MPAVIVIECLSRLCFAAAASAQIVPDIVTPVIVTQWPVSSDGCFTDRSEGRKEMFYLTTLSTHFVAAASAQIVPDIVTPVIVTQWPVSSDGCFTDRSEGRKEMFYLTTLSTHFVAAASAQIVPENVTPVIVTQWPVSSDGCFTDRSEGRKEMFYLTTLSTHFVAAASAQIVPENVTPVIVTQWPAFTVILVSSDGCFTDRFGRKEMFYLTTHSTHFAMAANAQIVPENVTPVIVTQWPAFTVSLVSSDGWFTDRFGRKERFYLTTLSTHFAVAASDQAVPENVTPVIVTQ